MTTRSFGEPIRRREDPRLVRGDGRFLDDLGHGAYEAAFLRSPHASARILEIDASDAIGLDGLMAAWLNRCPC
jgi:carbon-monoxide dehydrogenase large subunit